MELESAIKNFDAMPDGYRELTKAIGHVLSGEYKSERETTAEFVARVFDLDKPHYGYRKTYSYDDPRTVWTLAYYIGTIIDQASETSWDFGYADINAGVETYRIPKGDIYFKSSPFCDDECVVSIGLAANNAYVEIYVRKNSLVDLNAVRTKLRDCADAVSYYRGWPVMCEVDDRDGFVVRQIVTDPISRDKLFYRDEVWNAIDKNMEILYSKNQLMRDLSLDTRRGLLLYGPPGCISGDAELIINRGGNGRRITMRDFVYMFHGGKRSGQSWNPDIPTYVQREADDGTLRKAKVVNAWSSGKKFTYTVTTNTGRAVRATDEHPFLTVDGWKRLDELAPGDLVHVRGEQKTTGRTIKQRYKELSWLQHHPYAHNASKRSPYRVAEHRLVAEAALNNEPFSVYLSNIRAGRLGNYEFIDPDVFAVHHKDHNPLNNELSNLQVLTHAEHHRLHAHEGKMNHVLYKATVEKVVSVELYGEEETFDIEVEDEPHNYLANGFVVHNTGKSALTTTIINERQEGVTALIVTPNVATLYLREVYEFASKMGKTIVVLEDIDMYLGSRAGNSSMALPEFLNILDGVSKYNDIVTIGTTNEKDVLDPAAVRSARFDVLIQVDYPNKQAQRSIFAKYLGPHADEVNIDGLVALIPAKVTGADIREMIRYTVLNSDELSTHNLIDTIKNGRWKSDAPAGFFL